MPVFESSRKVQLFGSSLAITLPALFVKTNEIEKGSVGKVYFGLDGVLVVSVVDDNKARESLMKIIEKIDEICLNQNIKEDQNVKQE
jgi:antitoxin component of MazEF toxin-antitoxin module